MKGYIGQTEINLVKDKWDRAFTLISAIPTYTLVGISGATAKLRKHKFVGSAVAQW